MPAFKTLKDLIHSKHIHLALVLCLVSAPVLAGNPVLEEELQCILDDFLAENSIAPGVSACAICPELKLNWSGATGTIAKGDSTLLTAVHTFRIASNTYSGSSPTTSMCGPPRNRFAVSWSGANLWVSPAISTSILTRDM